MASVTSVTDSVVLPPREPEFFVRKYRWPAVQLNVWMLVMLGSAAAWVGIFGTFVDTQRRLLLGIPWYFPYIITVGSLGIIYVSVLLVLIFQHRLLPSIVMIGGFMMFVLWMVGLIVLSLELWGPAGDVNGHCSLAVFNLNPTGQSETTLAWMEQRTICQAWQAAFAFGLIGIVFLLWIMAMAYQVFVDI